MNKLQARADQIVHSRVNRVDGLQSAQMKIHCRRPSVRITHRHLSNDKLTFRLRTSALLLTMDGAPDLS